MKSSLYRGMEERPALVFNSGSGGRRPGCFEHHVPHGPEIDNREERMLKCFKEPEPTQDLYIYVSQSPKYEPDSHLARERIVKEK